MNINRTLDEEMRIWMEKLTKSVLPPDPLRIVEWILSKPAEVEHIVPLPPLVERIHSEFVEPMIEKLPRLPLTGDAPIEEWLKWKKE